MRNKPLPKSIGPGEIVFKGELFEVVKQPMKVGDYEYSIEIAKRPPGARLIIVSPDKKILLTKEYRHEHNGWDFRLPGGKVVDSLDEYNKLLKNNKALLEMAEEGARREALEEVGIIIDEMKHFTTSHCAVTIVWDLYYFVVTKYHNHPDGQHLEPNEDIKLGWYSFKQAKKLCLDGSIKEDRSVAVLLRFLTK